MNVETPSTSTLPQSIGWLGGLPDHWGTRRLKYLVEFSGGGTPSKAESSFWGGDIPWVSPKDMKSDVIADSADHITEDAVRSSATRIVPEGSVLIVVRSGILRHTIPVAIAGRPVALNQDMKALIPSAKCEARFLRYVIQGRQHVLLRAWTKTGATVESIEHELLANTIFPVPPLEEQRAIADYLDGKTAAIDALIAKRERHVELLEERHLATVSTLVTSGLDASAPVRQTGIPWLGEVPAHWVVADLKRVLSSADYGISDSLGGEGEVPVLRMGNVRHGEVVMDDLKFVADVGDAMLLRPLDLLFNRTNSLDLVAGWGSSVGRSSSGSRSPRTWSASGRRREWTRSTCAICLTRQRSWRWRAPWRSQPLGRRTSAPRGTATCASASPPGRSSAQSSR